MFFVLFVLKTPFLCSKHIKWDKITILYKKALETLDRTLRDESTQFITLPNNFWKITVTTQELVDKVFPNLTQNY